jgi:hypothetical protein
MLKRLQAEIISALEGEERKTDVIGYVETKAAIAVVEGKIQAKVYRRGGTEEYEMPEMQTENEVSRSF